MTEADWLAGNDPDELIAALEAGRDHRKLRLLCCGFARRVWGFHVPIPEAAAAIETAELFADGRRDGPAVRAALTGLVRLIPRHANTRIPFALRSVCWCLGEEPTTVETVRRAAVESSLATGGRGPGNDEIDTAGNAANAAFLRDVFGNPFRPVAFLPGWLTPTAVGIAEAIYTERAFDRLPILADALQDAGCEDAGVLAHCRGDGPHVRGCWVVDGVLGRG